MKTALLIMTLSMSVSFSAMAAQSIVKSCETVLDMGDSGNVTFRFHVMENDGVISTLISQVKHGKTISYIEEENKIDEDLSVRAGITADDVNDEDLKLNRAEILVKHAMMLESDPVLGQMYTTGLDLKAIRSATVYVVGQESEMGSTSLVEAKDASGEEIGTFLGGFLIGACK